MQAERTLVVVIALCSVGVGGLAPPPPPPPPPPPAEVLLGVFGRPFAPTSPPSVSARCRAHSWAYLHALAAFEPWALNMYDSSSKIPSGVITGNIQQTGHLEQCLAARHGADLAGQLCSADIQFSVQEGEGAGPGPRPDMRDLLVAVAEAAGLHNWTGPSSAVYRWAFCVPSSCRPSDVTSSLLEALRPLDSPGRVTVAVTVADGQCLTGDPRAADLQPADLACIGVFSLFALAVILSTTFDLAVYRRVSSKYKKNRTRDAVLLSFSLASNGSQLLETKAAGDSLLCLNGLKFLTLCWVVFGHTYYINSVSPQINSLDVQKLHTDWTKMVVMNGTLCTDTFFLLGGALLSYVFLRQMDKTAGFNLPRFYLHRYIRLTPALAAVVFFYSTLFYKMGSGPLWATWVGNNRDYCIDNWWTNLLYINNYIDVGRMCMDHTWYLAVDMQLFWVSPLVVYPLWRWPRVGRVVLGAALAAACAAPFLITYTKGLAGAMLYATDMVMVGNVYVNIYIKTYARAGPYLIGIALGCALHASRGQRWRLSPVAVGAGWAGSCALCLAALLGVYPMYQEGHHDSALEAASYAALGRSVWALGVAWVVFACVQGYGGVVNGILSWKVFLPLSRISYSAYLCHFIVLLYNAGSVRTPGFYSSYEVVRQFLGNLVITLLLATAIYLTFEVPFLNLDRVLLAGGKGGRRQGAPRAAPEPARVAVEVDPEVQGPSCRNPREPLHPVGLVNEAFEGDVQPNPAPPPTSRSEDSTTDVPSAGHFANNSSPAFMV